MQRQRAQHTVTFDCCFKSIMICNYDSYQEDRMQICIHLYLYSYTFMTSLPASAPSGRGETEVEGGARGHQRQSPATVARQHQVHWGAVQAEDADGGHHARLHRQTADEAGGGESGVCLLPAVHHRERTGPREGQGDTRSLQN